MLKGTIHETGGGVYRVRLDEGTDLEASLRGRLKQEQRTGDRVVVGDRVEVRSGEDGAWTIESVEPREREVVRRGAGGRRAKVVAANVDRLVVVMAAQDPEPSTERIDRLLVIAEANRIEGCLVVNKVDLDGEGTTARLAGVYGGVGYTVLGVSAQTGEGMEALTEMLCRRTSALVGPSGVGKSSLLNTVQPGLRLRTGELSGKIRRGRHTTVGARLLPLDCGGAVVDTPGFSDVGLWGVEAADLDRCFPEMDSLRDACRFHDCAHLQEPDCAVREGVEEGRVAESRYRSYVVLMEEARTP